MFTYMAEASFIRVTRVVLDISIMLQGYVITRVDVDTQGQTQV